MTLTKGVFFFFRIKGEKEKEKGREKGKETGEKKGRKLAMKAYMGTSGITSRPLIKIKTNPERKRKETTSKNRRKMRNLLGILSNQNQM